MGKSFQPMLSAKLPTDSPEELMAELKRLTYPLIGSPKIDGIRVIVHPQLGAVTRTLKPVPNAYLRRRLAPLIGFDGEITRGHFLQMTRDDVFNASQSLVMTHYAHDESPTDFTYSVFDIVPVMPSINAAYSTRYLTMLEALEGSVLRFDCPELRVHDYADLTDPEEVLAYEEVCLKEGYEGIMLRNPETEYKFGRSTLRQQGLIKLKRFEDAEAIVIGIEPMYKNENDLTQDERGYAKRSSHKANMVELPMVGAFTVDFQGNVFNVGAGRTDHTTRNELWHKRDTLIGKFIKFKYQKVGTKDAPRFPIFIGFRSD